MQTVETQGVILMQLGTPDAPDIPAVRRYLEEFLMDPYVIDLPFPVRFLLVKGIIGPSRSPKSAKAYQSVWMREGSPLAVHSHALVHEVSRLAAPDVKVALAMRYGSPSLAAAVKSLTEQKIRKITVLPLYPQEAYSSTTTAVQAVRRLERELRSLGEQIEFKVIPPFPLHEGYLSAFASSIQEATEGKQVDHLLLSYHGLPYGQLKKKEVGGGETCRTSGECCDLWSEKNARCYRAQSFEGARRIAALSGFTGRHSVSFQSRLGRARWLLPSTEGEMLERLAQQGVRRLAVACPSFVADCLETLEEIGVRARDHWRTLGGDELILVPCPNAREDWARAVVEMIID